MKTLHIKYQTLKQYFIPSNFKEPVPTEVYYKEDDDFWCLEFIKDKYYIHCKVFKEDLFVELGEDQSEEAKEGKINAFKMIFLRKAIKISSFGKPKVKLKPATKPPDELVGIVTPAINLNRPEGEVEPAPNYN